MRITFSRAAVVVLSGWIWGCAGGGGDAEGNDGGGGGAGGDATPPAISSLTVTPQAATSMVVTFETDEPAYARVDFGPTISYGDFVQDLTTLRTQHSFTLADLDSDATYHYSVRAMDSAFNVAQSDDATFLTPDVEAPLITAIDVDAVDASSALVTWSTDEPATSRVDWGTTATYGNVVEDLSSLTTTHALVLTELVQGQTYHFKVTSVDDEEHAGESGDQVFEAPDATPPAIAAVSVTPTSSTSARVTWTTNEPANGRVDFGTTTAYGGVAQDLFTFTTTHQLDLTGLTGGQTYHFRISSADQDLNLTQTPDDTFFVPDAQPPAISAVTVSPTGGTTATVTWVTDEPATSRVDWGTTPAYGAFAQDLGSLTTFHSLQLTGLSEGVTYHFMVSSLDAALNLGTSSDDTFLNPSSGGGAVSGSMVAWQPLEIEFQGPMHGEADDAPNPFTFYRLIVYFQSPTGNVLKRPGFFDGDGDGGGIGDVWKVRFSPPEAGQWSYVAHFDQGPDIAMDFDEGHGTPVYFDGESGTFTVTPRDSAAPGFWKWGALEYAGGHYLKFAEGPYFLKGGCDSPENFLGYKGFDHTFDQPGGAGTVGLENGLHRYLPHVADWQPGDPFFVSENTGYDSKGIIGALNYLSSRHVNSIYFLPMNLGGDGQETYPFLAPTGSDYDNRHYDVSKLNQWNMVFEHAQKKGILLHFVLNETEPANETFLDGGVLGPERRLFYREMVARFGHHLAIKWNLCEETDFSVDLLRQFATHINTLDQPKHPITFHTRTLGPGGWDDKYQAVLGDPLFSMTSIQGSPDHMGSHMEKWRNDSAAAGRPWVVEADEQNVGLTDVNTDELRRKNLYDVYFSGGGLEWYFGYHDLPLGGDLRVEDFRTREDMWDAMWYARSYVETYLPFWQMQPADHLLTGESPDYGGGEVFVKPDQVYAIYLPATHVTGNLDLTAATGTFTKTWYDPRTGTFAGTPVDVPGGGVVSIGAPPNGFSSDDWVVTFLK